MLRSSSPGVGGLGEQGGGRQALCRLGAGRQARCRGLTRWENLQLVWDLSPSDSDSGIKTVRRNRRGWRSERAWPVDWLQ